MGTDVPCIGQWASSSCFVFHLQMLGFFLLPPLASPMGVCAMLSQFLWLHVTSQLQQSATVTQSPLASEVLYICKAILMHITMTKLVDYREINSDLHLIPLAQNLATVISSLVVHLQRWLQWNGRTGQGGCWAFRHLVTTADTWQSPHIQSDDYQVYGAGENILLWLWTPTCCLTFQQLWWMHPIMTAQPGSRWIQGRQFQGLTQHACYILTSSQSFYPINKGQPVELSRTEVGCMPGSFSWAGVPLKVTPLGGESPYLQQIVSKWLKASFLKLCK